MCIQQLVAGQAALGLVSELGRGISLLGLAWASSQHGGFRAVRLLLGGSGFHHEAFGETSRSCIAFLTQPWKSLSKSHSASPPPHSWLQGNPSRLKGMGSRLHPWQRSVVILEVHVELEVPVETLSQPSMENTTCQKAPNSVFEGTMRLTSFPSYRSTMCSPTSRRASALCLVNTGSRRWSSCLNIMESICPTPV